MSPPIHRYHQDEATAAADIDMCYCLVPVSIDIDGQTSRLSLPDGTSIPIPKRLKKDLLGTEEAEQIRPGITRRAESSLAPFLTFRREDQVEATDADALAPIVSPDSEVGAAKGRHSAHSHQVLAGTKKSLFSSNRGSNAVVGSKVLEVEMLEAPPGKNNSTCIDLCDSDDEEESRPARSAKHLNRSSRKKSKETNRLKGKSKACKTRYTLSAPGFTSEEDDGHESDSTFEEETDGGDEKAEEDSYRVLQPISSRARLKYGEGGGGGGDDDDHNSDDDNGDDDDDDSDDNDDDASSDPVDVRLFCSWCGEHHNQDDFSLQQQANFNDQNRFCLLHHGIGYQTTYVGTSSVRKLASELDRIGEKYKDVGSDDEVIGDSDFSDEDDFFGENDNVANSGNERKCSPKRITCKRKAEDLLGEESDSDEDDFKDDERLHTQPPYIFNDDDDDNNSERLYGERKAGEAKRRHRIIDNE